MMCVCLTVLFCCVTSDGMKIIRSDMDGINNTKYDNVWSATGSNDLI